MYVNTKLLIKSLQCHMQWSLITGEDINLLWCIELPQDSKWHMQLLLLKQQELGDWAGISKEIFICMTRLDESIF